MLTAMFDRIFTGIIRALVFALLRPKVRFEDETVRKAVIDRPSILVCNHTGHLDGPILNSVLTRNRVHTLAAKDRFCQKGFGFFLRHTYCIPIDRENVDTSWLHESMAILKAGNGGKGGKDCVAIYPEGRHGSHRRQLPFHSGVIMLTMMAGVPVVPVYLDGPFKFFHKSNLIIGKPLEIDTSGGFSAASIQEKTDMIQAKIKDLMNLYIERYDRN